MKIDKERKIEKQTEGERRERKRKRKDERKREQRGENVRYRWTRSVSLITNEEERGIQLWENRLISNRVAARVATHCCFTAASPHHGFSRARYYPPRAPARAVNPHLRTSQTTAPRELPTYLYLPTLPYPTLLATTPPRLAHDLFAPEASLLQRLFLPVSLAREARNGKSTRNRMTASVTSIPVILRNIRIENFNIQNCRAIFLCTFWNAIKLQCEKPDLVT